MTGRRTCDGCGAAVLWVRSAVSPAIMILDAVPVATGTITINAAGRAVVGSDLATGDLFAPAPAAPAADVPRYRDHHATCTNPPRRGRR
jgi:hypothetical protein